MDLYYARRCKRKEGVDLHNRLHLADNEKTFCGSELDGMWYIENSSGLNYNDINCLKCKKIFNEINRKGEK